MIKKTVLIFIFVLFFIFPQNLYAQSAKINCIGNTSINTAIGCISYGSIEYLAADLFKWGLGIGGGIAFLLILLAGFQITTSRGDPKRLQAGQELLTSAIAGLVLLIFSVFILKLIGIDILGIDL